MKKSIFFAAITATLFAAQAQAVEHEKVPQATLNKMQHDREAALHDQKNKTSEQISKENKAEIARLNAQSKKSEVK